MRSAPQHPAFRPGFIGGSRFLRPLLGQIIHPLFHLLRQRPLLQVLHRYVLRRHLPLGDHLATGLAKQRNLIDPDFQQIHLQLLGIHVVQPRLQNIPPHPLFARTGEGAGGGLLAGQAGHHADITDRNADGIHDINLVAVGIQAILARPQHPAPDAFLARLRQELAGRQFSADLGGDHTHLAGRNGDDRHDPVLV